MTLPVLKAAIKEPDVSRPMKPAVNSIRLKVEEVNPNVNALWREGYVSLRIKALI